jgi:hypothetical protein
LSKIKFVIGRGVNTKQAEGKAYLPERTGMSVTEGTGQAGNTFVKIEVKGTCRKKKSQAVAEAVGMWQARGVCAAFCGELS